MLLSTKGRYGLRAMIDLAQHCENEAVSLNSIAQRQQISEGYLEQLIATLKKAGLVKARRGAGGGYVLARPSDQISAGDILRALEGGLESVECGGLDAGTGCEAADECVTKYVWQKINDSINQTVDEIKLAQLVCHSRKVQADQTKRKANS